MIIIKGNINGNGLIDNIMNPQAVMPTLPISVSSLRNAIIIKLPSLYLHNCKYDINDLLQFCKYIISMSASLSEGV